MALCEKIVIAGFSGAGKSRLLYEIKAVPKNGWTRFDDLDELVLKNRGKQYKDLAGLVAEVGWEQFRIWERQELEGWLKIENRGVLALGGGSLSPLVWELYGNAKKIRFCYLKANFETCWERLLKSSEVRPLVQQGRLELEKIFKQREQIFSQIPWQLENEENSNLKALAQAFWLQSKRGADTIS